VARHVADGKVHIAVGTQALIQEDVEFANLGLVVADEQHKLGVRQRATLRGKAQVPHYLVMTATPIPRTLALSYFADLDVSTIDELPPEDDDSTKWLKQAQGPEAYHFVREQVETGSAGYVVLAQIEDNGMDDAKSLKAHFEKLSKGRFRIEAGDAAWTNEDGGEAEGDAGISRGDNRCAGGDDGD